MRLFRLHLSFYRLWFRA